MRRVVVSEGVIEVVQAEQPVPGPGEALVQMIVSGICGSDTHAADGRHPFVPLPYHPGHEVVGTVRDLGEGVTGITKGQRVTVEPTLPCWICKQCRAGRENLCENLVFFGCGYAQGGMADFFTVPAGRLHVIPDGFTDQQAALVEPMATPVHAVRIAGDVRDKAVVVLGAGTIGLLVTAVARYRGARRIVVTDMLAAKRERALRVGADAAFDAAADDLADEIRADLTESADVVFDCVAIQSTVTLAIALAQKAGTVVVVGVPVRDVSVPLPIIQDQQVRIQGSATYLPEDYADAITIIASGAVSTHDIVTAVVDLEDVAKAFSLSGGGEQIKVLVAAHSEHQDSAKH